MAMTRSEKIRIFVWPGRLPRKYDSITHITAASTGLASLIGALCFLPSRGPYGLLYFAFTVLLGTYLGRAVAIEMLDRVPVLLTGILQVSAVLLIIAGFVAFVSAIYFTFKTGSLAYLSGALLIVASVTVIFRNSELAGMFAYLDLAFSLICIVIFLHGPNIISGVGAGLCLFVTGYYFGKTENHVIGPTPGGTSSLV